MEFTDGFRNTKVSVVKYLIENTSNQYAVAQVLDSNGNVLYDIDYSNINITPYIRKDEGDAETSNRLTEFYNFFESNTDESIIAEISSLEEIIFDIGMESFSDFIPLVLFDVHLVDNAFDSFTPTENTFTLCFNLKMFTKEQLVIIDYIDGVYYARIDGYEILEDGTVTITYMDPTVTTMLLIVPSASIPTITFNANSGTFPTSGGTQTTYNSTELTGSTTLSSIVETPTKPGYVFQGWSTTSTGVVQYTQTSMPTISSDTTLYAIYEPDTTKVLLEKGAVDIILGKLK